MDAISLADVSEILRFALEHLLEDLDYEACRTSGSAVAALVMVAIIIAADEMTASGALIKGRMTH
jgi:hypothetical protein